MPLKVPETLRVRRGDVYRDVGSLRTDFFEARLVVVDRALARRVGVLADVDTEDAAPARAGDVLHERVDADVVEAETVDERLRLRQPEQARLRIARLRARRYRADLDEAEAQLRQRVDVLGVLVETRGEAHGIGKFEAQCANRTRRNLRKRKSREAGKPQGQVMRSFRV